MSIALLSHINRRGAECSEQFFIIKNIIDRPTDIQFPLIRNKTRLCKFKSATVRHHKLSSSVPEPIDCNFFSPSERSSLFILSLIPRFSLGYFDCYRLSLVSMGK